MIELRLQGRMLLFWLLTVIHLAAIFFSIPWLQFFTKPLLIPALAFMLPASKADGRGFILCGLFFSWLGDIFLMFDKANPAFFIAGLASFLFAHIAYITYFLSRRHAAPSLLQKRPLYALAVVVYGIALVWLLYPSLGELKIPVVIYAAVICTMLCCSIHRFLTFAAPAGRYFILGAAFFVLSDSILAVNKFLSPLPMGGVWVMLTYCVAQYFIVVGFLTTGHAVDPSHR